MANDNFNIKPTIWLGYDDEFITDKHKGTVDYTISKVGGKPDSILNVHFENPTCPICQFPRPLIVQVYAPIDNQPYHRTLYVFACINPNCWNKRESWICFRAQLLDTALLKEKEKPVKTIDTTEWCQGFDDWDDNEEKDNANYDKENGNVATNVEINSDEEESCSYEELIKSGMEYLCVDECNANLASVGEARGGVNEKVHSPKLSAEIEDDESELISIDTPTLPQRDLYALFLEKPSLPQQIFLQQANATYDFTSSMQFVPFFVSFVKEGKSNLSTLDRRARELALEYQRNANTNQEIDMTDAESANNEAYEHSSPIHGNKMFHLFINKISENPGQIIRYSRDYGVSPLLLKPLKETLPKRCKYCGSDLIFEFQLLPTLIAHLQLKSDEGKKTRLEFGTVIIFTCASSCWSQDTNFRDEIIIVQEEP